MLEFKDGIAPNLRDIMAAANNKMTGGIRPSIPGGKAPATPSLAPQTPAGAKAAPKKIDDDDDLKKRAADEPAEKRAWDDEEEKKPVVVDEEAKKKARAEMRKKLMLPDSVNSKLKGNKPLVKKEPETKPVNNGDISIRDIKKPDEEKKVPFIKIDNL